ncbi:FHA domain-containing protein [Desulfoluna sp.]|uniref:FHA domain-containing protein n=1 Tax=Desulfoluna sp. TaxID=2045199 RepID=UPI002611BE95|nr:FHA domain-containing protein [Desulfoluna sp.]
MPVVQLQFKDRVISRHRVEPGGSLTIGRHPESDVVIDNAAVSGKHAKIDGLEGGYFITDLKSTNGTVINRTMITTCQLKHGDSILIGRHQLIFGYARGETRPERELAPLDKTVVMDVGRQQPSGSSAELNAYLSILKGGSGDIPLTKKVTKIGKDPACDIVVPGFGVGKISMTISKMPKSFLINYISGFKRPRVNGEPLRTSVKLREFDTVEIGTTRLQFVFRESLFM